MALTLRPMTRLEERQFILAVNRELSGIFVTPAPEHERCSRCRPKARRHPTVLIALRYGVSRWHEAVPYCYTHVPRAAPKAWLSVARVFVGAWRWRL
jgi:hypothetical protein